MSNFVASLGDTGMADAVLNEIAALANSGGSASIELTAMPLTREDRAKIERRLGRGEVQASVESVGRSEVWETAYAGVWFVRHFGDDGQVATEAIEICAVPAIVASHPADRRAAAAQLAHELRAAAGRAA